MWFGILSFYLQRYLSSSFESSKPSSFAVSCRNHIFVNENITVSERNVINSISLRLPLCVPSMCEFAILGWIIACPVLFLSASIHWYPVSVSFSLAMGSNIEPRISHTHPSNPKLWNPLHFLLSSVLNQKTAIPLAKLVRDFGIRGIFEHLITWFFVKSHISHKIMTMAIQLTLLSP